MPYRPHRLEPNYPGPEVVTTKSPAPPIVVECWCLMVTTMDRVRRQVHARDVEEIRCQGSRAAEMGDSPAPACADDATLAVAVASACAMLVANASFQVRLPRSSARCNVRPGCVERVVTADVSTPSDPSFRDLISWMCSRERRERNCAACIIDPHAGALAPRFTAASSSARPRATARRRSAGEPRSTQTRPGGKR